jgi:hypothetical protein
MLHRTIFPLLAILAAVTFAPSARAHWFSGVGRYLGAGWGDGYHAKNACPPRRAGAGPHGSAETPWWAMPGPHQPAGPSLFRQPGEGSSVIVTETPAANP